MTDFVTVFVKFEFEIEKIVVYTLDFRLRHIRMDYRLWFVWKLFPCEMSD